MQLPSSPTTSRILFLALLFLTSAAQVLAQAEPDSLVAWPGGMERDFGELSERGVERYDTFFLQNPTEEAFIIESIRPSCGCTAVDYPKEPIEPEEVVAIPVAFRCTKGGYVERHLDVWLSHLRTRERLYVIADCPRR